MVLQWTCFHDRSYHSSLHTSRCRRSRAHVGRDQGCLYNAPKSHHDLSRGQWLSRVDYDHHLLLFVSATWRPSPSPQLASLSSRSFTTALRATLELLSWPLLSSSTLHLHAFRPLRLSLAKHGPSHEITVSLSPTSSVTSNQAGTFP